MNQAKRRRSLPKNLAATAARRTDSAVSRVIDELERLEQAIKLGTVTQPVSLKELTARAQVGEKFLFGPKHRSTTKLLVDTRLADANRAIALQMQNAANESGDDREAADWRGRYERLAQFANLWFIRMHDQQRTIIELRRRLAKLEDTKDRRLA